MRKRIRRGKFKVKIDYEDQAIIKSKFDKLDDVEDCLRKMKRKFI